MRNRSSEPHRQLFLVAMVQVLAMALWFSASAVGPALADEWSLSSWDGSLLTSSVQLGFVVGAVGSAVLNLADRVPAHLLMSTAALVGAVGNAAMALWSDGLLSAFLLRFGTGVALAGVYPVGMKIMTTWFATKRGFALGVMVGALTLGSASPQLLRTLLPFEWRSALLSASALAMVASVVSALLVRARADVPRARSIEPRYIIEMFADRTQRLVNVGYLGHMWELYALWAWLPLYIRESLTRNQGSEPSQMLGGLLAFGSMGIAGAIACIGAGLVARTRGSVRVARAALIGSGVCCVASPLVFGASPVIMVAFTVLWGGAVIADSAQFSSALSEAADPRFVGTALTTQTALGFSLTIVTIQALPLLADAWGWQYAFVGLALGPLFGVHALTSLLAKPAAKPAQPLG